MQVFMWFYAVKLWEFSKIAELAESYDNYGSWQKMQFDEKRGKNMIPPTPNSK